MARARHGDALRVVLRSAGVLAAVMLLAGCPGTSGEGTGGTGTSGSSGSGYGGQGGSADGGDGAPGRNGAPGADGAPGSSYSYGSPDAVAGFGRLTSRTIDLAGVTSVVVGANFVVHLRIGGPPQATVKMDDNLADRVEASVIGDQLRLGIRPGMSVRDATLSAEVTVSQLDRLATSGASRVTFNPALSSSALQLVVAGTSAVTGPVTIGRLEATVSGASTLALSGQVEDLYLSAAGASRLPISDLVVRRLDAKLSGTSHVTVTVTDTLAAEAAGVSVLRYRGAPAVTRAQTSGVSSIASAG